jgi:GT2 family glycosyltransferase
MTGRAAWLSDEVLLCVVARGEGRDAGTPVGVSPTATFPARWLDGPGVEVYAVSVARPALESATGLLSVHTGGRRLVLDASELRDACTDLRTLLRERFARWDAVARSRLLGFLASLGADPGMSPSLSEGLHRVREALRERRPIAVTHERAERDVHVERIDRIDERAFYLEGWAWDSAAPVTRITAVTPEGERVELLPRAFRCPRPDLADRYAVSPCEGWDHAGLACYFETVAPSRRPDDWVLESENAAGRAAETATALASAEPVIARNRIVASVAEAVPDRRTLLEDHVWPAVTRLQAARRDRVALATIETYGDVPDDPEVSIIVPLYRRVDLLEHQLVAFADDPSLRAYELLYVLDSPDHGGLLRQLARGLFDLYDMPFRVLTLSENGGCALARDHGASVAAGRRLLFLDSDVIPDRPGWLDSMASFAAATPAVGPVAPKLLYDDGGIQHAGLAYAPADGEVRWTRTYLHQGLDGGFAAANVARPVPAVTGSCMLLDAALYRESRGTGWAYVQGGYEDSDLCLRLGDAGRESWYLPHVALHHLEGQSYAAEERAVYEHYNRWLHARLCGDLIQAAMTRCALDAHTPA